MMWRSSVFDLRSAFGRGRPGFTLLETLVGLAILAFSLATLMGSQAVTAQKLIMAEQLNTASLLVRSKMMAIEDQLREEGFEETIYVDSGDFRDEGFDGYEWLVEIEPVEISEEAEDQFVANIHDELYGSGAAGDGSLTGSAAVSQYLPMIIGQVPRFINQVGARTRKITLSVSWQSTLGEQHLTVTEYFVVDEEVAEGTEVVMDPSLGSSLRGQIQDGGTNIGGGGQ